MSFGVQMDFKLKSILSAKDLISFGWNRDSSIPIKGCKEYAPDGSWLEAKRLETTLQERRDLLLEERVAKLGALARCAWRPSIGKCEVTKHSGKFWQIIGHSEDGVHYLYPEEALFLLDCAMLEIYYEGIALNLQLAHSTFIGHHVSLEEYQTYSFLARFGFILRRYDPDCVVTDYERKIRIDQCSKMSKKRKKKQELKNTSPTSLSPRALPSDMKQTKISVENIRPDDIKSISADSECKETLYVDYKEQDATSQTEEDKGSVRKEQQMESSDEKPDPQSESESANQSQPRTIKWDWDSIPIPDIAGKSKIIINKPKQELFPCCVHYDQEVINIDVDNFKRKRKWDGEYEFSLGGTAWKSKINAGNWLEYRCKYKALMDNYSLQHSPAGHLWTGKVQPLVKPQDATSPAELLRRLRVIDNVTAAKSVVPTTSDQEINFRSKLKISFDVHLPNSNFKKSMNTVPNHRVCVVKSSDPFPSMAEMKVLVESCKASAPLHFAVIDGGDISFYAFHNVQLPVDTGS